MFRRHAVPFEVGESSLGAVLEGLERRPEVGVGPLPQ